MTKQFTVYLTVMLMVSTVMSSCSTKSEQRAPKLDSVNYDQLFSIIKQNDDKLYVVNFWATWCRPCMEELPHFLEVDNMYRQDKNYQMILVSLDKSSSLHDGVEKVVKAMNIKPDVLLLDDTKRMNEWIPMINGDWDGAIPVTAFYKNGIQVSFHEGQLSKIELEQLIKKHI